MKEFALWPPPNAPVSAESLAREMSALMQVTLAPPPLPTDAVRGNGQPVIVIPGFIAPEASTERLREFLIKQNFSAVSWAGGVNLGPMPKMFQTLDRQVAEIVSTTMQKVSLVGVSLGGTIARELAKRQPEKIRRVITVFSPIRLPVVSPLAPLAQAAAFLWDQSAKETLASVRQPPPVPLTILVSPIDGVIDWHACLPDDPDSDVVEIEGPHMSVGSNPEALRVIADRLAGPV